MVLRRSLLLLIALLLPTVAFATTTYVVKKGDNLYDLSRKHGVSVEDIKSLIVAIDISPEAIALY